MKSNTTEQKLYLEYVRRCDRVMRVAIALAIVIGSITLLASEYLVQEVTVLFLAISLICTCGVPLLYYNIVVTLEHRRFMKKLNQR